MYYNTDRFLGLNFSVVDYSRIDLSSFLVDLRVIK
jgi:hypothetical protein